MKKMLVLGFIVGSCLAFTSTWHFFPEEKPVYIPSSVQRTGDAATGYTYLTTGDYLKSGIPLNYFKLGFGKGSNTYLQRDGVNQEIPYEYTAVKAANGEIVIAPNCLQCHASIFDNKLYIGLGNTTIDFSSNQKLDPKKAETAEELLRNLDPKKYEAAEPFLKVVKTIGGQLSTKVRGVNSADRLAALLAAHRDRNTFQWSMEPLLQVPDQVIPTDVPPWWLLKKKHAMFYNGFGRGDFSRFLMASNLLTVNDTSESREVDSHFSDVLAYIYSLKSPPYPGHIDRKLAKTGGQLYVRNCSKCHGNNGSDEGYPNLLIPESVIQTDSFLFRSNYQSDQFIDWFNSSWFAKGDHPARLQPFNGYIAPPLDGIWITAPYLHNGSVPTLEGVLDSRKRPAFWARDFNDTQYDLDKLSWPFEVKDKPEGTTVYNTTLPGYGNYGHYFGDKLSEKERRAIIEYLKTL
jgi:mono/diheme cytochrome c family protein